MRLPRPCYSLLIFTTALQLLTRPARPFLLLSRDISSRWAASTFLASLPHPKSSLRASSHLKSLTTTPFAGLSPYSVTRPPTALHARGMKNSSGKTVSKSDLPSKDCVVCGRPFTWRKKWERCWDEVTCCSKSCNAKRRSGSNGPNEEG